MKIPEGYSQLMPYLIIKDAPKLIEFLKKVFGAELRLSVPREDGTIMHAEIKIGEAVIMLSEARPKFRIQPAGMFIYVDDTDATYKLALSEGATSVMEPAKMEYADRAAGVADAFGNTWWLATCY
jgi:PhnB protein